METISARTSRSTSRANAPTVAAVIIVALIGVAVLSLTWACKTRFDYETTTCVKIYVSYTAQIGSLIKPALTLFSFITSNVAFQMRLLKRTGPGTPSVCLNENSTTLICQEISVPPVIEKKPDGMNYHHSLYLDSTFKKHTPEKSATCVIRTGIMPSITRPSLERFVQAATGPVKTFPPNSCQRQHVLVSWCRLADV